MKVIKGKSVNGVSQQPCPHYFKSYDVRIGFPSHQHQHQKENEDEKD
jgi:hypothetical protein